MDIIMRSCSVVFIAILSLISLVSCDASSVSTSQVSNELPNAEFSLSSNQALSGQVVSFDASASNDLDGSIQSYVWDFGDGNTAAGVLVNHQYTVPGIYSVVVTVTDDDNAKSSSSVKLITVIANQSPTALFSLSIDSGDVPLNISVDASSSSDVDGSIVLYSWNFGDGNIANGVNANHQYTNVGNYYVVLTTTDNYGNQTISAAKAVNVTAINVLPIASFNTDVNTGPLALVVNFDAADTIDSDGAILTYRWDFGDGFKSEGQIVTHTYMAAGLYSAVLTVTDNRGGQHSVSQSISVTEVAGSNNISGQVRFNSGEYEVDSDINDINANYKTNNSVTDAQVVSSETILSGYLTKTATGITGQRFSQQADEIDIFRMNLQAGQNLVLEINATPTEPALANDFDLYLYSINDTQTPIASIVGSGNYETLSVSESGEYFVAVTAYSGRGNYVLKSLLGMTGKVNVKSSLSLDSEFVDGQVIAKLKPTNKQSRLISSQNKISDRTRMQNVVDKNNMVIKRGSVDRSMLLSKSTPINIRQRSKDTNDVVDQLFDGRYGLGMSQKHRKAYQTIKQIKALRADTEIEYAEPNYIVRAKYEPNDLAFADQWHYKKMNLPQVWDQTTGDSNVIVAVIDSGVFMAHEDLSGNLLTTGYDMISDPAYSVDGDGIDANPDDPGDYPPFLSLSSWHGTHVAGIIAASTNNLIGVAGVAPDVRIMPMRVLGFNGGSSYDVMQAILYAAGLANDSGTVPAQSANIINMSLGGGGYLQSNQDVITAARAAGVIFIAAAGNENSAVLHYPSSYAGVISVSAVGQSEAKAVYSNYGSKIDVAAYGGDSSIDGNADGQYDKSILSTIVDVSSGSRQSAYAYYEGTSMAAPNMAGVVALMKSVYAELDPDLLDTLLRNGLITTDLSQDGPTTRNDTFGYGLIDPVKAINQAQSLAAGTTPPDYIEVSVAISTMVDTSQQIISISQSGGTASVLSTALNYSWATLVPVSVDVYGFGDYQLDIDRSQIDDGIYPLEIDFVLDTATSYMAQIEVVNNDQSTIIDDAGPVYVLLVDADTQEIIRQTITTLEANNYNYTFSTVPSGDYEIYIGTDRDADGVIRDEGESCNESASIIPNVINWSSNLYLSVACDSSNQFNIIK